MPVLTIQDLTMRGQITGVENARPDNDGPVVVSIWPSILTWHHGDGVGS